jgi:hypothetical protein
MSGEFNDKDQQQDLPSAEVSIRERARKRVLARRNLQGGVVAYIVVNGFLVALWALTGRGYFWPGWVMAAWGLGMIFGIWNYIQGPVSEEQVDREMRRMQRQR